VTIESKCFDWLVVHAPVSYGTSITTKVDTTLTEVSCPNVALTFLNLQASFILVNLNQ